jgi:hypothetical protein
MAIKTIIICDYCGKSEPIKGFYSIHDFAEGNRPPHFVTITLHALYNDNRERFVRWKAPAVAALQKRYSGSSTNGTIRLELCLECALKPLFETLEIRDPPTEEEQRATNERNTTNED